MLKTTKIGNKIILTLGVLMSMSFASVIYYYTDYQKRSIITNNEHNTNELTGSVLQSLQTIMLAGYADIARSFADNLKKVPQVLDFRIMRANGLEAFHDNKTINAVNKVKGEELFIPRDLEQEIPIFEETDEHLQQLLLTKQYVSYYEFEGTDNYSLTYLAPIPSTKDCEECHNGGEAIRGIIKMTVSMAPVMSSIKKSLYQSLVIAFSVITLMLVTTQWLVNRLVGRPAATLTEAMGKAAKGKLDIKIPVVSNDELGKMASSFNTMIANLNQAQQNLLHEVRIRKDAESRLYENKQRLKAIVDNAFNALVTIDQNGSIITFNPSAERMFGFSADEAINKNINIIVDAAHRAAHVDYLQNYNKSEDKKFSLGQLRQVKGAHKDGRTVLLEMSTSEYTTKQAKYYVATLNDITQRVEMETALDRTKSKMAHQEKMSAIGSLAAGLVHEIGNPLAAISGLVEKVNSDIDSGSLELTSAKEDLALVVDNINRLIQIIRDVSGFSSSATIAKTLLDINGLIRQTCRLVRYDKRLLNIELKLDLDCSLPAIFGSENSLTQVMVNLIQNATDAFEGVNDRARMIIVSTRQLDQKVVISVQDNGMGMDQQTLSKVFEAFFTTKPVNKGTGLGLSVCYSIIKEHDGTIEFASEPGIGTQCNITLPTELPDTY